MIPKWTDILFSKRDQPSVERVAHAAHKAEEAAAELSQFVRHQLHMFGSDEGEVDEGRLRDRPLAARARAARMAHQFFGTPRKVRGEP